MNCTTNGEGSFPGRDLRLVSFHCQNGCGPFPSGLFQTYTFWHQNLLFLILCLCNCTLPSDIACILKLMVSLCFEIWEISGLVSEGEDGIRNKWRGCKVHNAMREMSFQDGTVFLKIRYLVKLLYKIFRGLRSSSVDKIIATSEFLPSFKQNENVFIYRHVN